MVFWLSHGGDARSNGCDSGLDSATMRSREVDLGWEEHSSRASRRDLRLLHNFKVGIEPANA